MKSIIAALILISPLAAMAAGGGHHEGIPTVVWYQLINIVILVGGIVYFTKDAVIQMFAGRKAGFLEASQKSALARQAAEKEFVELKGKITELDATRTQTIQKAQAQAEELKKQIQSEADAASKRIRAEAELTAKLEAQRAQSELREQLIRDSMAAARTVLTKDLGSTDQQSLQSEFIKNLEVVNP